MMTLGAGVSGTIHWKTGWRTDQISGEDVEDARAVQLDPDEEGLAEFRAGNIFTLNKEEFKRYNKKSKMMIEYNFSLSLNSLRGREVA